mgnify:CR=1 FL=1
MSYLGRCEELAQSIRPKVLREILEYDAFTNLVQCFLSFSESYTRSRAEVDIDFIRFSRGIILQTIKNEGVIERYLFKLALYKRLAEYKIYLVDHLFHPLFIGSYPRIGTSRTLAWFELISMKSLLCSSISQIFFSIEHCCRIACSLGDVKFAQKVAGDEIIDHRDVFKTLKNLSERKCLLDFNSLRKLYAYAIKTRMAADYTEFFHEEYDAGPFVFSVMLPAAINILNSQRELLFECVGV